MSLSHKGKENPSKRTDVREKIRQSKLGKKRPPFSDLWKKNMSNSHKGLRSNWQGGKTALNQLIRSSQIYIDWRNKVFKRDKYRCQSCGQIGGDLHADHIIPFAKLLRENKIKSLKQALVCLSLWNIEDGKTLCLSCHKKTETYLNVHN